MARNSLGSLQVSLGLDAAEFTAGLNKGEYAAKKFSDNINKQFSGISGSALRGIAAGLAGAFSVTAIVAWGKEVVGAAENLRDLATETGSSVEALSRLQNIATIGGAGMGEFQGAIERLAAGLNGSEELSTKTAHALQFLGITAKDPAEALQQIADKLEKYSDSTSKAALARDLFGKAGVRFLSTLHDIATATDVSATVTARQAAEAEALSEALRKLSNQSTSLSNSLLSDIVPAMSRLIEQFTEGKRIAGGFFEALRLFGSLNVASTPAESIKSLNQEISILEKSKGNLTAIGKALDGALGSKSIDQQIGDAKKKLEFVKLLQRQAIDTNDPTNLDARDLKARQRPNLGYTSPGPAGPKDDSARRALDAFLKDTDRRIKEEEDQLKDREQFLNEYYRDDQLSIAQYYATRQELIGSAIAAEVALYDQEEAAVKKRLGQKLDASDRVRAEEQLREVIDKRAKAEKDAAIAGIQLTFDQVRATKQYQEAVANVAVQLQELRGDTVGAGLARLQQQQASDRAKFTANGNQAALDQQDAIIALTRSQLQLNEATARYGRVQESISIAQQRIDLLQQTGAITEIDAINKRAQLSRERIGLLQAEVEAAERVARAMEDGPVKQDALLRVEQMKLAIDQLAAQADALAKKFNDVFAGAFSDALTDFATHAKSAKDIIKDTEKSIVQSISRIASNEIAGKLFGKDGALGGIGGFFAKLFGGGDSGPAGASGAAALTGAGSILTTAGSLLTTAAASLQAAAASMVAGSAAGSVNGIANGLGGFFSSGGSGGMAGWTSGFDIGGFFAGGGMPPVGKVSMVGEQGRELFIPRVAGTVLPNDLTERIMRGGRSTTINVTVPQGISSASSSQIGAAVARRQNQDARRNL